MTNNVTNGAAAVTAVQTLNLILSPQSTKLDISLPL